MRILMLTSLLLLGCAGAPVVKQVTVQDASTSWETAVHHDFAEYRVRNPPHMGVMGASAVGFLIEDRVAGMAVVDNNARGTISVFIGWGVQPDAVNSAPKDLRVVFVTKDGSEFPTRFDAGGGNGLLFYSPADVPREDLAYMEIRYPKDARWLSE